VFNILSINPLDQSCFIEEFNERRQQLHLTEQSSTLSDVLVAAAAETPLSRFYFAFSNLLRKAQFSNDYFLTNDKKNKNRYHTLYACFSYTLSKPQVIARNSDC